MLEFSIIYAVGFGREFNFPEKFPIGLKANMMPLVSLCGLKGVSETRKLTLKTIFWMDKKFLIFVFKKAKIVYNG